MNKTRKWFVALFCTLLLVCSAFLAACNSGDKPEPDPEPGDDGDEFYTVTAEFDETKGTIELTSPANTAGYAKGEEVTATVTPNAEYTIGAVTVNGQAVTLTAENTYTFGITGNTTIAATFTPIDVGGGDDDDDPDVAFTADFAGTWTQINGGNMTFTVTEGASAVTITGGAQNIEGTLTENKSDGFIFATDDAEIEVYALGTDFLYYTVETTVDDVASYASYVFAKGTWAPIAIAEGNIKNTTWTAQNGTDTLAVGADGKITMTIEDTPMAFDIFYHDIADGTYYVLIGEDKIFSMVRFEAATCSVNGDAGEYNFNAPDPDADALFPQEYRGTWKQINTTSDVTIVIDANTFSHNGNTYEATARDAGGYTYKNGNFNTPFYLLGDNVLCVEFNSSNFGFFTYNGEAIDLPFPAGYAGEYTSTNGQALTIASNEEDDVPMLRAMYKINANADAKALQIVYVEYETVDFGMPTPKLIYAIFNNYGYTTYKITFNEGAIVMMQLGGYMSYTFTKAGGEGEDTPAVESEEFATEWRSYWRQVDYKNAYIRIIEDGGKYYFYYNEKDKTDKEIAYAATKEGEGYKVTIDEVQYTVKMTSDKNFIYWTYEKNGAQIAFFGKASSAEDYSYATKGYGSVFPDYVDSTYTDEAREKLLFACEGQKDVFFDDRDYKPSSTDTEYEPNAQWGDDYIIVVTFQSDSNSGTAIVGAKWYTFSFTGTSADDFSLTFTAYDGQTTYTFTKKVEEEKPTPTVTFTSEYQGTWVDSDEFTIDISKNALTVQAKGDAVATPCTATLAEGVYSFTYHENTYTLTVVSDDIIYTTDQSGARHYYMAEFGPNVACKLQASGANLPNNSTWKTESGDHTLQITSFHFNIDGTSYMDVGGCKTLTSTTSKATCYWNNMYWSSVTVSADGNTLTFTSHDGSQTLTFTKQA